MKTVFFGDVSLDTDSGKVIKKVFDDLIKAEWENAKKILDDYFEIVALTTSREKKDAKIMYAKKIDLPYNIYDSVFQLIGFLSNIWTDKDYQSDSIDNCVEDLVEAEVITAGNVILVKDFWNYIERKLKNKIVLKSRQDLSIRSSTPHIVNVEATASLRGVFASDHHFSMDTTNYNPELINLAPVVNICFFVDTDRIAPFHFDASDKELKYIINALQAVLQEVEALQSNVKIINK